MLLGALEVMAITFAVMAGLCLLGVGGGILLARYRERKMLEEFMKTDDASN